MSAPGSEAAVSPRTALTARFTAPGAEFEVVEREVRGIPMRVYAGGCLLYTSPSPRDS